MFGFPYCSQSELRRPITKPSICNSKAIQKMLRPGVFEMTRSLKSDHSKQGLILCISDPSFIRVKSSGETSQPIGSFSFVRLVNPLDGKPPENTWKRHPQHPCADGSGERVNREIRSGDHGVQNLSTAKSAVSSSEKGVFLGSTSTSSASLHIRHHQIVAALRDSFGSRDLWGGASRRD